MELRSFLVILILSVLLCGCEFCAMVGQCESLQKENPRTQSGNCATAGNLPSAISVKSVHPQIRDRINTHHPIKSVVTESSDVLIAWSARHVFNQSINNHTYITLVNPDGVRVRPDVVFPKSNVVSGFTKTPSGYAFLLNRDGQRPNGSSMYLIEMDLEGNVLLDRFLEGGCPPTEFGCLLMGGYGTLHWESNRYVAHFFAVEAQGANMKSADHLRFYDEQGRFLSEEASICTSSVHQSTAFADGRFLAVCANNREIFVREEGRDDVHSVVKVNSYKRPRVGSLASAVDGFWLLFSAQRPGDLYSSLGISKVVSGKPEQIEWLVDPTTEIQTGQMIEYNNGYLISWSEAALRRDPDNPNSRYYFAQLDSNGRMVGEKVQVPVRFQTWTMLDNFNKTPEGDILWIGMWGGQMRMVRVSACQREFERVPPSIEFENLENEQVLSGDFALGLQAGESVKVDIFLEHLLVATVSEPPHIATIQTDTFPDGNYKLSAIALGKDGSRLQTFKYIQIDNGETGFLEVESLDQSGMYAFKWPYKRDWTNQQFRLERNDGSGNFQQVASAWYTTELNRVFRWETTSPLQPGEYRWEVQRDLFLPMEPESTGWLYFDVP